MKKLFVALLCFLSVHVHAASKNKFTISGKVQDTIAGTVYLRNLVSATLDTITIKDGIFNYTGSANEIIPMVIKKKKNRYQLFFIGPGNKVDLMLNRKEMQLTYFAGSPAHDIFRQLITKQDPLQKTGEYIQQLMSVPNANRDSLQAAILQLNNERNANFYWFLKEYGNSEVAAFLIFSSINQDRNIDAKLADTMVSFLQENALKSHFGKAVKKSIEKLRAVTIGYDAPDFVQPDSSGKIKYKLSDFKGKYVLVDFWLSWCGPSKAEIPFMKEAYTKFHDKGFEIFSVSLDDKCEAWKAALRQFQMPWPQGSDCKGFRNEVNELYPIPSIPKTLLLDKTGKIIGADLRGPALENKLKELLGDK